MEIYTLTLSFPYEDDEDPWSRTIEVKENFTLKHLHNYVQEIIDFDNDHLYEFYIGRNPRNRARIIPKKAKKTNSFSVRIRLNKFKRKTTGSEVEIMLVIKDPQGKTLKIDVKKVDLVERKGIYLTFYETIKDKLEINKNYTFSVFADKVLIKNANKLI